MTEAVVPVMDHAFNNLGFEKMVLANDLGNDRSRRVKEKTFGQQSYSALQGGFQSRLQ